MTRTIRTLFPLSALLLLLAGPARADDPAPIPTEPGHSVIVADHLAGKAPAASAKSGTVRIAADPAHPDKELAIIYTPPDGAKDLLDTVTYTPDGGTQKTVQVQVRAGGQTLAEGSAAYAESFKALFELFIIAILVESGLALLFRWKPFLTEFDPAAVNAVVAFLFSYIFVYLFDLDIVTRLFNVYSGGPPHKTEFAGQVLTAMIIAGGSSVVNKLFQAFGMRSPLSHDEATAPKVPPTMAWIAVTPRRVNAVGEITVLLNGAAIGTIEGGAGKRSAFSFLFRDKGRFPPSGGFAVAPTVAPAQYTVSLAGHNATGAAIASTANWGPYSVTAGAILDIELTI